MNEACRARDQRSGIFARGARLAILGVFTVVSCQCQPSSDAVEAAAPKAGREPAASRSAVTSATAKDSAGPVEPNEPGEAGGLTPEAPEVKQLADYDCGPAALQSVLTGFGLPQSYRDLVQESKVDPGEGASIDTLEDLANAKGLVAEQIMIPHDFLFEAPTFPMIVVLNADEALLHFVVVWKRDERGLHVMDPALGKREVIGRVELLKRVHVHEMDLPTESVEHWMHGGAFEEVLMPRMAELGFPRDEAKKLWAQSAAEPTWVGIGALDAAIRVAAGGPRDGSTLAAVSARARCTVAKTCSEAERLPQDQWSVVAAANAPDGTRQLQVRGALLINFSGGRKDSGGSN